MGKIKTIARRSFLIGALGVVGGAAFGVYRYKTPYTNPLKKGLNTGEAAITPFVKIDGEGITLITPRADKGQGAYSLQAMLLAEELDVDPTHVKLSPGMPAKAYYNSAVLGEAMPGMGHVMGKLLAIQVTGGSSTAPDMFTRMRVAGAVARETLKKAAAKEFNVALSDLSTEDGHVIMADGKRVAYRDLAPKLAQLQPVKKVSLRPKSEWRYLGKPMRRLDIVPKSTGQQIYGIDLEFDDMLYASVRVNPRQGGKRLSFNADIAKTMRGVKKVASITNGVAVIADNTWRAFQALDAVDIEWGAAPYPASSEQMWTVLENHLDDKFRHIRKRDIGNAEASFREAPSGEAGPDRSARLEASYRVPHLAHAPLEPMNAVVKYTEDRLDIWTGTQIPLDLRRHAAELCGLGEDNISVHVQMMGGSFGRRLEDTYVMQAIEVAMAMPGLPIKMTWSREHDFSHDYPRPMALAHMRGVVENGAIKTMDIDLCSASVAGSQFVRLIGSAPPIADLTMTAGADDQPYTFPNYRVSGYKAPEMVPISSWRSVGASQNGYFHECFLDELIHKAGLDPLMARLEHLKDDPLSVKVLEVVAEMANWNGAVQKEAQEGTLERTLGAAASSNSNPDSNLDSHVEKRGRGVAFVKSFGVRTAVIVDVVQTTHGIKIEKVWGAAEVGMVLDPINFEAQFSGGIIWGLGHAMNCELTYENYVPTQTNFHDYQAMNLYQTPEIIVRGLENGDEITGMGEPGVPPAAPALANAIFAATGQRIRELPLYNSIDFA